MSLLFNSMLNIVIDLRFTCSSLLDRNAGWDDPNRSEYSKINTVWTVSLQVLYLSKWISQLMFISEFYAWLRWKNSSIVIFLDEKLHAQFIGVCCHLKEKIYAFICVRSNIFFSNWLNWRNSLAMMKDCSGVFLKNKIILFEFPSILAAKIYFSRFIRDGKK